MGKEKHYKKWTRKEFETLPRPNSFTNQEIGEVDCLIILPQKYRHDSGYRCMSFVTIQNDKPTYSISGCSDVINLGGIGGFNCEKVSTTLSERIKTGTVPRVDWKMDCLPVSGLLRIFCRNGMYVGASVSSFEIYFKER